MRHIEPGHRSSEIFDDVLGRNTADYLLRTTQQHHVQVSAMADTKANIIITVSSIVLTLALGSLADGSMPLHLWAMVALTFFTLVALLLAVLAVLPKYVPVKLAPDEPLPDYFNLLFFGHFAHLSQERYLEEMHEVLANDEKIYDTLCKDIYGIGSYLHHRKYRYLRLSYLFFLVGFVLAAIAQLSSLLL